MIADSGDGGYNPQTPPIYDNAPYDQNNPPPYLGTPPVLDATPIAYLAPPPVPMPVTIDNPPVLTYPPITNTGEQPPPMPIDYTLPPTGDAVGRVIHPMPPIFLPPDRIDTNPPQIATIGPSDDIVQPVYTTPPIYAAPTYQLDGGGVGMPYGVMADTNSIQTPSFDDQLGSMIATLSNNGGVTTELQPVQMTPTPLPPIFVSPPESGTSNIDPTQITLPPVSTTPIVLTQVPSAAPPVGGGVATTTNPQTATATNTDTTGATVITPTPILFAGLQSIEDLIKNHPYVLLGGLAVGAYFLFADK